MDCTIQLLFKGNSKSLLIGRHRYSLWGHFKSNEAKVRLMVIKPNPLWWYSDPGGGHIKSAVAIILVSISNGIAVMHLACFDVFKITLWL